jgi:hypothetical protein
MKEVREFSFWRLMNASWRGHNVIFGLTKNKDAIAMLQLTSVNKDIKIILMPEDSESETPTKEQFESMEKYFSDEGYFDFIEELYNSLNDEPQKINDEWLKDNLEDTLDAATASWNLKTLTEYEDNETSESD